MTKVILTAQVKNGDAWEKAFQTHGDFFRSQGRATSPIQYTRTGNEVALFSEVPDVNAYRKMVDSPRDRRGNGAGWSQAGDRKALRAGEGAPFLAQNDC